MNLKKPLTVVDVREVRLDGVEWLDLLDRQVHLTGITVVEPVYYGVLPSPKEKKEKTDALRFPTKEAAAAAETRLLSEQQRKQRMDSIVHFVQFFFDALELDTLRIVEAGGEVRQLGSPLHATVDSLCLKAAGLGYSLVDSIPYHYCDSVYELAIGHASVTTPDGLMAITTSDIYHANGGPLLIGQTTMRNTISKWKMAKAHGNQPASWVDLTMRSLRTSSINAFRVGKQAAEGFSLDSVFVDLSHVHVFADKRYLPKAEYPMPQEPMLGLQYPFLVRYAKAHVGDLHVEVAISDEAVGQMRLRNSTARVRNISAVRGSVIRADLQSHIGKAPVNLKLNMHVEPDCSWSCDVDGKELQLHDLDDFLYPLAGLRIGCHVGAIKASYAGNKLKAAGTFCMEYDGLKVEAFPDSPSPIRFISKSSKFVTGVCDAFLPKQNPSRPGKKPLAYKVQWKHDTWQQSVVFFIGPIIDGALETMLPGLFVHKRSKEGVVEASGKVTNTKLDEDDAKWRAEHTGQRIREKRKHSDKKF